MFKTENRYKNVEMNKQTTKQFTIWSKQNKQRTNTSKDMKTNSNTNKLCKNKYE